jgi:hypothetical protein
LAHPHTLLPPPPHILAQALVRRSTTVECGRTVTLAMAPVAVVGTGAPAALWLPHRSLTAAFVVASHPSLVKLAPCGRPHVTHIRPVSARRPCTGYIPHAKATAKQQPPCPPGHRS